MMGFQRTALLFFAIFSVNNFSAFGEDFVQLSSDSSSSYWEAANAAKTENHDDVYKALQLDAEILDLFKENYVEEIDALQFTENLLKQLPKASDPFSHYLNEKQNKEFNNEISGQFGGIGIHLKPKQDPETKEFHIMILRAIDNTPAQRAGLKEGELIAVSSTAKSENKVLVKGLDFFAIIDLIRGEVGTPVCLWILQGQEVKEILLVRAVIENSSVDFKKMDKKIGYLKISEFSQTTEKDFDRAVSSLTDSGSGLAILILDVRDNPGGLLRSVVAVIDKFKSDFSYPTVYTKTRKKDYKPYRLPSELVIDNQIAEKPALSYKQLKVIVLINGNTASAAEILAGWFREDFGAPVIGEKSFGKGSVQNCFPLKESSRLCLTIAHYYIGKNKLPVHETGIQPTIPVKNLEPTAGVEDLDLQLKKAMEVAKELIK